MLIDWFTVVAQALNFVILVWLLRRSLYKPILNAIAARETLIAGKLADADAREAQARKAGEAFRQKNEAFDRDRAALMTKATDEAAAESHKRLDEAREAAVALVAKRRETMRTEAAGLAQAIRMKTQQEVFAIARRTLSDLAGVGLEDRMADVFTQRLRAMDGKAKETFALALKTATGPALARCAFDLPEPGRVGIQKALDETFGARVEIRFETTPDLVGGIELTVNGQKLAWSIADYLGSLEKGVGDLLDDHDKPNPKPKTKPKAKPEAAHP